MRRITLITVLLTVCNIASAQQTIQLFQEDFNAGNGTFTLNSGGPAAGTGPNQWIVNDEYDGAGVYPNTTDQSNTSSGTIAGAPYSTYLHVHDNQTSSTTNCNYDNAVSADQFAYMSGGFCTVGLIDIEFTFFYLAEGTSTDYGRVYYSIDGGGSWVQCGNAMYNNTTQWTYQVITDPVFENQPDVRFGFRWTNSGSGGADKMSFGIDDIIAVGTYDTNNPVEITITSVSPNPVCEGNPVTIFFELSYPLCEGTYEIELSNSSGSFSSSSNLGVFTVFTGQTSGAVSVLMPSVEGPCYKVRINRVAPPPAITGEASICIEVIECPNTITTLQPPVTFGPDTLCNQSVIDVPFYSTGTFNSNNNYIAQLSDEFGNFGSSPTVLGTFPSSQTFDPSLGSPPGTVSGLVPGVVPSCNYYIRVISTSPAVIPPPANYFGPFCIRECDVTSNNMQDIHVCITPTTGADTTITLEIDSWNNGVSYGAGNEFLVQVLNSSYYTILNTGDLGYVTSTTSTSLTLTIPNLPDLIALIGPPGYGMYYLRLISTNASSPSDTLGTLVRLIIGVINPPGTLTVADTTVCPGTIASISLSPFDWNSSYQWYSPSLNNNQPFYWTYNPLLINFPSNMPISTHWFTVREVNNGCFSPWADTVYVYVLGIPNVTIQSTTPVCVGDSVHFWVPFLTATYYDWTVSGGEIVEFANNEITVIFDSAGAYTISVFALNECGSNTGDQITNVLPRPEVITSDPDTVCPSVPVTLTATGSGGTTFIWYTLDSIQLALTSSTTVITDTTQQFVVTLASPAGCKDFDTALVAIYPAPEVSIAVTDVSCYGLTDGSLIANVDSTGSAPFEFQWNTGATTDALQGLSGGDYWVTVTDSHDCTASGMNTVTVPPAIGINITTTAATYGQNDASATATASGGTEPYYFTWSTVPPSIGSTVEGLAVGTYTVTVVDAEGCENTTTVEILYAENGLYIPNVFSPNGDGVNDVFDFYGVNLANAVVAIYNRWGQCIFRSNDFKKKWNGKFNGTPVEIGVYVYYIEASFLDGGTKLAEGNVSVIR